MTTYNNIWCKSFPGFYCTMFEPREDTEIPDEELPVGWDNEHDDIWNYFDDEAYETDMCKHFLEFFSDALTSELGDGITLELENVDSPRYYNFSNDNLMMAVKIENNEDFTSRFYSWIDEHKDYIAERLKDDFTSRSGFIPYYEDDYDKFMADVEIGNDEWAILLSYIAEFQFRLGGEDNLCLWVLETSEVYTENYFKFDEFKPRNTENGGGV